MRWLLRNVRLARARAALLCLVLNAIARLSATHAAALAPAGFDLCHNQALFHLYREGLVIPFTGEGFRKYVQEYSQPFTLIVRHEGTEGRVLSNPSATLTLPAAGGAATLVLRVHGLVSGQKLSLHLNGQLLKNTELLPAWQVLAVDIPAGRLRAGENTLRVTIGKKAPVAGQQSYGLFHSLDLVPGTAPDSALAAEPVRWPAMTPVGKFPLDGKSTAALMGFRTLAIYLEVPHAGTLHLRTGVATGEAKLLIAVETADGAHTSLLHTTQKAGWQTRVIDLAPLAGKLVRLSFTVSEGEFTNVAWVEPRIELNAATALKLPRFKHAILVVVDALRADRLSIYGQTRVQTPSFVAAFAKNGVAFLHNQAASPSSPPSHGSIQTGMIPRVHGVTGDKGKLVPGTPMISTQLGTAGFATGYFGNNPFGMARLEEAGQWTEFHQPNQEGKGIDCTVLVNEMLGFARKQSAAGKRFFISSLPYEPHTPYRYHAGVSDKYHPGPWEPPVGKLVDGDLLGKLSSGKLKLTDAQWNQLKALYDGEVEHMDGCFGQLLTGLSQAGLADDTLVVVTADHGEGMFEHGYMGHAFGHFGEVGNVPLILYGKGLPPGMKVDVVTSHLDIAPTILELLDVKVDARVQGRSLVPLVERGGHGTPRVVSLEYGRSYALRARDYRYIVDYQGVEMLYDLVRDPSEQKSLIDKGAPGGSRQTDFALRYMRDLTGFFLAHRSDWRSLTWGDLNNHGPGFGRTTTSN